MGDSSLGGKTISSSREEKGLFAYEGERGGRRFAGGEKGVGDLRKRKKKKGSRGKGGVANAFSETNRGRNTHPVLKENPR